MYDEKQENLKKVRIKAMDAVNPSINEFKESQSFISHNHETKIAIDEEKKRVCIWTIQQPVLKNTFNAAVYDYSDVLSVEIIKGNKMVTSTSRTSQVGGALLGGVLAGGVGAVIGGLSGSTTTTEDLNPIDLGIVVNDFNNPYYKINFYTPPTVLKDAVDQSYMDNTAMPACKKWYSILSYLIKETDKMDNKKTHNANTTSLSNASSLKEELLALNELKQQGILTQEEFEKQKSKILNK